MTVDIWHHLCRPKQKEGAILPSAWALDTSIKKSPIMYSILTQICNYPSFVTTRADSELAGPVCTFSLISPCSLSMLSILYA